MSYTGLVIKNTYENTVELNLLNLPQADWNGSVEGSSGNQALI
jgi:nitrogen fixation protein FixH